MGFAATALFIYLVLLTGYVLSYVHRTVPAAIAGELTQAFEVSGAVLGTLAATYFYVYTVLQIPVGVLADTIGPRIIVTAGAVVAAFGSILFGLAPGWEWAAVGRVLVGVGVAVTFVALLKVCANWFPPQRFATLNGITLLAGNLGAAAAGAPLAWLVTVTSWRSVFVGLGLASLALAVLTWIVVRDSPRECGFEVSYAPPPAVAARWMQALRAVLANPASWPGFFVNIGVAGSFFAFAGLWVVPYLREARGLSQAVASNHGRAAVRPPAQPRRPDAAVRRPVRAVVAAFGAAAGTAPGAQLRLVLHHGSVRAGLRADVDRGQGNEPAGARRHCRLARQRRHFSGRGDPATTCRRAARRLKARSGVEPRLGPDHLVVRRQCRSRSLVHPVRATPLPSLRV